MTFLSLNDKPADDYWSMELIKDVTDGLIEKDRKLIIIPGEYQDVDKVNNYLSHIEKVLLVVASDEENQFDINKISHGDIIIYSMYPTDKFKNVDYWLPLGYTPHTRPLLKKLGLPKKSLDWFFSGQITHESRRKLVEQLKELDNGDLNETAGFTQGYKREKYMKLMWQSKVVPSSGGFVPEAFRTYEALEAGAIPIIENTEHHLKILNDIPFVGLDSWDNVNDYITNYSQRYPQYHNEVFAWWQMQKRQIRERFKKDLGIQEKITVVVPTSPVKSNPNTEIIEETVASIKRQLSGVEIIITFDGVRTEQVRLNRNYQEYIRKVLWKCNYDWHNVTPIVFKEHTHQVGMMKATLPYINTPHVLYVEHDAPLTDDFIEWRKLIKVLDENKLDLIRFHFENEIPKPHSHMMLDEQPFYINKTPFIRTAQWSQRPHLATKEFYERILRDEFSPNALSMIEDLMHGVAWNSYKDKGKAGWNKYRLAIYAPDGGLKRSYHLDARSGGEKYDEKQVF